MPAWQSVVAGACIALGAVDVVWLGTAAEDAFATPSPDPIPIRTPDPIPTPSPDPIPIRTPDPIPIRTPDPIPIPIPIPIPSTSTSTSTSTIYFDRNSDELTPDALAVLDTIEGTVTIEGHADERGTDDYNLALSRRRAERVAEYLAARGVEKPTVRAFGESQPLGDPHLDRRVEIHQEEAP